MSGDGGLFADLARVATAGAPRTPRAGGRVLTWRHGLVPWTGLLTLAAVAVGLNLVVVTSSVEVLGWVLIGGATLVLLVSPSGLVERPRCIPRWCLALMIVLHLVAVLVAPRGGKGWFVLADGLILVGAAAVAR